MSGWRLGRSGLLLVGLVVLAGGCGRTQDSPLRPPLACGPVTTRPALPLVRHELAWNQPATAASTAHDLVLVVPGAGGEFRDLSLAVPWDGTVPATTAFHVRAWLQQRDLQPVQISKQQRTVSDVMRWERDGDTWRLGLRTVISSPPQARQPGVIERLVIEAALQATNDLPSGITRIWSQPPWRRTDLPLPGSLFTGSATIAYEIQRGEGEPNRSEHTTTVWLSQEPQEIPGGPWSREGDGRIAISATGMVEARLHERPSDAGEGPTARRLLAATVPGAWAGVEVVYDGPNDLSVPVRLAVQLQLGEQWVDGSIPLASGPRRVVIPAAAFVGDGSTLSGVTGIGIGLRSGYGAGVVQLAIRSLTLRSSPAATAPVLVTVDPTRVRIRNGSDRIPEGLFGVHMIGPPPAASAAALRELRIGSLRTIEHTGFDPLKGPPSRDGIRQGLEVIRSDPKLTMDCWTHGLLSFPPWGSGSATFAVKMRAFGESIGRFGPAAGVINWEVFNEPFMWARHINLPGGPLWDPTQHGYLPMGLSANVYVQLFRAAADGARGSGVRLGGPSSASFGADDWRHLEGFVLPVVKGGGDDLAFVAEHHYQGDPRSYAAEYAVLQAAVAPFRTTPLEIWNTECNDLEDRPGRLDTPEKVGQARALARRRAWYHIAEICQHITDGFDHTKARAIHGLWRGRLDVADEAGLRLLRDLRGQPMVIQAPESVVAAGARSGTTGVVVLAARNGAWLELRGLGAYAVGVEILERGGDQLIDVRLGTIYPKGVVFRLGPGATVVQHGDGESLMISLPAHGAVAIHLAGLPPAQPLTETVRWAGDAAGRGALWRQAAGSELRLTVDPQPGRAQLQLIAEDLQPGEAWVEIDGRRIPLPASEGPMRIHVLELAGEHPPNQRIRVITAPDSDGWRLCAMGVKTTR